MNKEYDVSVIIPIYNSEEYIEQGIQSVLNQSNIEVELILVNDGSTDGSAGIIDEYAKKYDSVKAIHQENAGVGAARNRGIREATGEYIAYLDSDDFYEPEVLPKLIEKCREQELDVLFATYMNFFEDEIAAEKWHKNRTEEVMRRGDYTAVPVTGIELMRQFKSQKEYNVNVFAQVANRDFLRRNNILFPEDIVFEDAPYTFAVLLHAKRAIACKEVLAQRRIRDNSLEHRPPTVERCYGAFKGIEPMIQRIEQAMNDVSEEEDGSVVSHELSRRYLFASKAFRQLPEVEQEEFLKRLSPVEEILFRALVEPYAAKYLQCEELKERVRTQKDKALELEKELSVQSRELENVRKTVQEKNQQIKKRNQEIESIKKSITFRIGKVIVGPFSFLKKQFK